MRTIKFRAWDKINKRFHNNSIDDMRMDYETGEICFSDSYYSRSQDEIVFMQFTGLKDKNGVEIYEGDIINCRDGKFIIEYEESFAKFIMSNKLIIKRPDQYWDQDANMCMRSIEVIGNIYENPELLEKQK